MSESVIVGTHGDRTAGYSGGIICYVLITISCFLWGTSQIAPDGSPLDFTVGWINLGDPVLVLSFLLLSITSSFRRHAREFFTLCRTFSGLVVLFAALGIVSVLVNSFARDIAANDIVEVLRPLYYLAVIVVVSHFIRSGHIATVTISYTLGIVFGSVGNLLVVLSGDVDTGAAGLLVLLNPNVTGHMLAIAILFSAITLRHGRVVAGLLISIVSAALVVFTFSKGSWLMALISAAVLTLAYIRQRNEQATRWIAAPALLWTTVIVVSVVAAQNAELIGEALKFKLEQSLATETELSDSSVALRAGHIRSSLEMAANNPLLGVGVTNWQTENDRNAYWLNDVFLSNDNPHNGFFYILSGMGIPAFIVFAAIILFPVSLSPGALRFSGVDARVLRTLVFLLLVLSGNVTLHIVSHYFFWLLCAITFGCALQRVGTSHDRQLARADDPLVQST